MARGVRAEERVGYVLKRVQQALRAAMDEALRRHGLTIAQYAALSALEEEGGLSGAELARRSFVTPQTMNEIVTHLEATDLVERRRGDDGRVLRASLTAAGLDLVGACHRAVAAIEERTVSGLNARERQQLLDGLRRCADALEAIPADSTTPPSTRLN